MVQYKLAMLSVIAVKEWSILLQFACVSSGYMTMTILVCFFEKQVRYIVQRVRRLFTSKPVPFRRRRKMVIFAHKYGVWGIALLSPISIGALAGSILAVSLGGRQKQIIISFATGCLIWTLLFLGLWDFFKRVLWV
ncbi:MAG: small multi-drug export protein [Bacteroidia bacterium]|nr:small multi-drug export protein [Bacteroidia bacterium]MDW8302276.1 small multi-drug export protein [Bacteroidia bacterium]